MTATSNGRFCSHCQTEVVDFTSWSAVELQRFFASYKGSVCGRLLPQQLNRPLSIPYQPQSRLYRLTIAVGLSLLVPSHLFAQHRPPQVHQAHAGGSHSEKQKTGIYGKVTDQFGVRVPGAIVKVMSGGAVVITDTTNLDGKYALPRLKEGKYTIEVLCLRHETVQKHDVDIPKNNALELNVTVRLLHPEQPIGKIKVK